MYSLKLTKDVVGLNEKSFQGLTDRHQISFLILSELTLPARAFQKVIY